MDLRNQSSDNWYDVELEIAKLFDGSRTMDEVLKASQATLGFKCNQRELTVFVERLRSFGWLQSELGAADLSPERSKQRSDELWKKGFSGDDEEFGEESDEADIGRDEAPGGEVRGGPKSKEYGVFRRLVLPLGLMTVFFMLGLYANSFYGPGVQATLTPLKLHVVQGAPWVTVETVWPEHGIWMSFRESGPVEKLLVSVGDRIREGEVLGFLKLPLSALKSYEKLDGAYRNVRATLANIAQQRSSMEQEGVMLRHERKNLDQTIESYESKLETGLVKRDPSQHRAWIENRALLNVRLARITRQVSKLEAREVDARRNLAKEQTRYFTWISRYRTKLLVAPFEASVARMRVGNTGDFVEVGEPVLYLEKRGPYLLKPNLSTKSLAPSALKEGRVNVIVASGEILEADMEKREVEGETGLWIVKTRRPVLMDQVDAKLGQARIGFGKEVKMVRIPYRVVRKFPSSAGEISIPTWENGEIVRRTGRVLWDTDDYLWLSINYEGAEDVLQAVVGADRRFLPPEFEADDLAILY
ncbi:MAG: hypothetical protein VYA34_11030 [Myxococcota bacterium]|nr:hypothetical protein [Myxococcota bacterium]